MSTYNQRLQHTTFVFNRIRYNGNDINGHHSESFEVLGTCTVGNCSIVATFMEVVGEDKQKTGKEIQLTQILKLFQKMESLSEQCDICSRDAVLIIRSRTGCKAGKR